MRTVQSWIFKTVMVGVWVCATGLLVVFILGVIVIFEPFEVAQALSEYLTSATVETIAIPFGCIETHEKPPADLMQIVENQKKLYNLTLQKVFVCRSPGRYPLLEQRNTGLPFVNKFNNNRWW